MKTAALAGAITVPKEATGNEFGLSGDDQIRIALEEMVARGGAASTPEIYKAVERRMAPTRLSDQGRASLRFFVNRIGVKGRLHLPARQSEPGLANHARGP